ncbi:signal peptidase II [Nakamurella antarctica]|uniref:Lipoprotein signal peptidase n=1 Tax=Nakamurella antarctica TaxID=1902245 RepID=A0A3G9A0X6_9ACTN|nr:signal peptidase II [Nakamurella antarctica]
MPIRPEISSERPVPSRKLALLAGLTLAIVVADLITKLIAVATLSETTPAADQPRILGGAVYFSLIRNPGAAFSLATGMTWVLSTIMLAVIIGIIYMAPRLRSTAWTVSLGLILGGAIGNFGDRVFRSPGFFQGHVVDFVSVFGPNAEHFPIFNVADSGITIGGILLVLTALSGVDYDGTRSKDKKRQQKEATPSE